MEQDSSDGGGADDEIDLNALRDEARAGTARPRPINHTGMSASEVYAATHFVNPDLHPGENMGPNLGELRKIARERSRQNAGKNPEEVIRENDEKIARIEAMLDTEPKPDRSDENGPLPRA